MDPQQLSVVGHSGKLQRRAGFQRPRPAAQPWTLLNQPPYLPPNLHPPRPERIRHFSMEQPGEFQQRPLRRRCRIYYVQSGGGKALIDQFTAAFGTAFDSSIHPISHILSEGPVTIGGMEFVIRPTADAFDVEIPETNAIYTHMLGHDCHSIVAGSSHADAMISQLRGYIRTGYDLILTSHYTPEDLKDAQTKIDYLEALKVIAASCRDGAAFKAEVLRRYPDYSGENYLDMTAGFFFG